MSGIQFPVEKSLRVTDIFLYDPFLPWLRSFLSFLYLQLGPLATKIFSDQRICADQTISKSFAKQLNLMLVGKDPQSSQCESPMNGLLKVLHSPFRHLPLHRLHVCTAVAAYQIARQIVWKCE